MDAEARRRNAHFAVWLKGLMRERRIRRRQLARLLEVSDRCVQNWVDGDRRPSRAEDILGLAHVLGTTEYRILEALVGGGQEVERLGNAVDERAKEEESLCRARTISRQVDMRRQSRGAVVR